MKYRTELGIAFGKFGDERVKIIFLLTYNIVFFVVDVGLDFTARIALFRFTLYFFIAQEVRLGSNESRKRLHSK